MDSSGSPSVLEGLLAKLDDPAGDDETDDLDGLEPFCAGCGAWVGIFYDLDGWRHQATSASA